MNILNWAWRVIVAMIGNLGGVAMVFFWSIAGMAIGSLLGFGIFGKGEIGSLIGLIGFGLGIYFGWKREFCKVEGTHAVEDVREVDARLKSYAKPFDPESYMDGGRGVFVGLNAHRQPVYLPLSTFQKNHTQFLGVSGCGKSSTIAVLLGQINALGNAVVIFDPKNDDFMPRALNRFAEKHGRVVRLIDLQPSAPPQINPFQNCEAHEVEELLTAAFGLDPSGDAAVDFHRGEDADAATMASQLYQQGAKDLPSLVLACMGNEAITSRQNFWRYLRQMSQLRPLLATEGGLDMADCIKNGEILYVVGSTDNLRTVTAQRLVLQRILQIIRNRPRNEFKENPVTLFLDEFKYMLSNSALRALGIVRDRGCNLILAHQSFGDLEDCGSLSAKAVIGAVSNTALKFVYRTEDVPTAENFAKRSGDTRVWTESASKTTDQNGNEQGSWKEDSRARISAQEIMHLPKPDAGEASVGVVFGLGPAFFISTRYLPAGEPPLVQAAPVWRDVGGEAIGHAATQAIEVAGSAVIVGGDPFAPEPAPAQAADNIFG